jgi:hypothetical protein
VSVAPSSVRCFNVSLRVGIVLSASYSDGTG